LWFNPVIPHEIITYGDMCHALKELYSELKVRKVTEFENAAIYTYVLIYQMYLNSMEELVFEKCVDSRLLDDPTSYCTRVIVPSLDFTLWTSDNKDKGCTEAGSLVQTQC
jgi:hypothetical protein